MDKRIFISYSSKDVKIADKIVSFIESNGYLCWIAPRNIEPGHDYTDCINSAIKNCCGVVLVFSEQSLSSQFVKKELGLAVHFNKSIIPYKIADFKVDDGYFFLLNNVQWIEASGRVEAKFPELLSGIEASMIKSNNTSNTSSTATASTPTKTPTALANKKILIISACALVAIVLILVLLLKGKGNAGDEIVTDSIPVPVPVTDTVATKDSVASSVTTPVEIPATEKKTKKEKNEQKENKTKIEQKSDKDQTQTTQQPKAEEQNQQPQTQQTTSPKNVVTDNEDEDEEPVHKGPSPYDTKLRNAKVLYNSGKYREALFLFQELKKDNPNGASLDHYINECKKKL